MKFKSNIELQAGLEDNNAASGSSGQILSSTGTGVQWIDQSDIEVEKTSKVVLTVKNVSGGTLSKGTVVHAAPTANPPSGNVIEVVPAENDVTASMPAIGVLNEQLSDNAEGEAVMFGRVSGIDTSAFSIGDELFVSDTAGTFTSTKPTGTKLIQKIAVVIKVHASNGTIEVFGAGRTNDVPTPLYVDHANQRLGIGTTSPDSGRKLDVDGHIQTRDSLYVGKVGQNRSEYSIEVGAGRSGNGYAYIDLTGDTTYSDYGLRLIRGNTGPNATSEIEHRGTGLFKINARESANIALIGGNVGIGTTTPSQKLDVVGNIAVSGTVDGVDIAAFKSAYDSHNHDDRYYTESEVNSLLAGKQNSGTYNTIIGTDTDINTSGSTIIDNIYVTDGVITSMGTRSLSPGDIGAAYYDHFRSLGTTAFTAGGGSSSSTTTSQLITEMENDGAFDSYTSAFKTSWSYAGNDNLTDAGRFTETAGTSWLTWTDNSSDSTRGNITALAIAPNTGGSAGKVFIYNDQGSGYSPGWREVWTSTSDGSGSGLDADLLDGNHASAFAAASHNHDDRYYTESESDSRFVNASGDTVTGNLTIGSGSSDNYVRSYYSDGTYTEMRGYGLYMSRISSYIRPVSDNTQTLFIGSAANQWNTIRIDASITRFETNGSESMRITSSGNVGIGTTSPGAKLHIAHSGEATLDIQDTGGQQYRFFARNSDKVFGIYDVTNPKTWFRYTGNATASSTKLALLEGGGNVGIGKTSPSEKLDVNGTVKASKFYLSSSAQVLRPWFGSIYIESSNGVRVQNTSGTLKPVTASAFNTSSDYRLKSNIVPLENAISRLNQLEVHRFNWNDRLDEPKVDGFIAHEVATVIPEAVLGEKDATFEDGTPDYQGIDQAKIVPLLTAALQEALQKIESLETRMQALENN